MYYQAERQNGRMLSKNKKAVLLLLTLLFALTLADYVLFGASIWRLSSLLYALLGLGCIIWFLLYGRKQKP